MFEVKRPNTNQPERVALGEIEQNTAVMLNRPYTTSNSLFATSYTKYKDKHVVDFDRDRTSAVARHITIKKTKEYPGVIVSLNSSIQPIKAEAQCLGLSNRVPFGYIHRFKVIYESGAYALKNETGYSLSIAKKLFKLFGSRFVFGTPYQSPYMHGILEGNFSGSIFEFGDQNPYYTNLCIKFQNSCKIQPRGTRNLCVYVVGDQGKQLQFVSKEAVWCPKRNKFIMSMGGRAKLASTSNCILINELTNEDALLVGKETDNTYNLDVRYPFSPIQAFAIAVSSICFKLSVY